jgi:hypothetical protein
MIFLESPDLGDPREQWIEWLSQLKCMNQRDISIKFAISRAEQIIKEMDNFTTEQANLAFA